MTNTAVNNGWKCTLLIFSVNLKGTNELTTQVTEGPNSLIFTLTFPMKSFKYNSNKKIRVLKANREHNLQKQIIYLFYVGARELNLSGFRTSQALMLKWQALLLKDLNRRVINHTNPKKIHTTKSYFSTLILKI